MRKKRIMLLSVLVLLVVLLVSAPIVASASLTTVSSGRGYYRYYNSFRQEQARYTATYTGDSYVQLFCGWETSPGVLKCISIPYVRNGQTRTATSQWYDVGHPYTYQTVNLWY
jgi:hypothetical protein